MTGACLTQPNAGASVVLQFNAFAFERFVKRLDCRPIPGQAFFYLRFNKELVIAGSMAPIHERPPIRKLGAALWGLDPGSGPG